MELSHKDRKRLERGDIITSLVDVSGQRRAQAVARIEAPPAAVWQAITDYEAYPEFMPRTTHGRILKREGNVVDFETTLSFPLKEIGYTIRLTLDEPNLAVDWTMIAGDLRTNDGSWRLSSPAPGLTEAVYTVFTDPGFYVPGYVLTQLTRGTLPLVIEAVRKRVRRPAHT